MRTSSPFAHIVKSRRARGTREETRKRPGGGGGLCRSFVRSSAACFARPNRRACSQANPSASVVTADMKSLTKMGYRTNNFWLVLCIGKLTNFDPGFQSLSVELGFWIPVVNGMWWDFGVAKLYSGFQIPGFQIPQPKRLRIPESQFPYMAQVSDETTEKSGTEKSKRNNEILFPPGPVIPRGERERRVSMG